MFSLVLSACSSDDDAPNNSNNNAAQIQAIVTAMQEGNWVITYFFDTDQEETSNFTNYTFLFSGDNQLVATSETATVTGSWSVTNSSNSSSSSDDDIDFNIVFATPPNFEELSDDWDIVSHSATKIELIDVSGGNGGTDYLTFEKL